MIDTALIVASTALVYLGAWSIVIGLTMQRATLAVLGFGSVMVGVSSLAWMPAGHALVCLTPALLAGISYSWDAVNRELRLRGESA